MPIVSIERQDDVALILIDNPPVNAASHAVRAGLLSALTEANADDAVRAIVIACAGKTFVAGADIREFGQPPREPLLPAVTEAVEASEKPVVAALHGTALGGGLEIALACHGRIASLQAEMGLPEVKLGLVPGAGGTQRLPRLVGMERAIELAAGGRRVGAAEALKFGLIDAVAWDDLVSEAVALARGLAGKPLRRTGRFPVPPFDADMVQRQIAAVERRARGQASPPVAARAVLSAAALPLTEGLAAERALFRDLLGSDQARALRHVFAAERLAARVPGLEGTVPRRIETVGVVGAGLMGAGIAAACLDAGFTLRVVEQDEAAAQAGRERIAAIFERDLRAGRLSEAGRAARLERLAVFADRAALSPCDLVIEAVFDDLDVKRELFASLSAIVRPDAVLATNTSYLDPDAIAAVVADSSRIIGLHFFSPANVMRLVEVVQTVGAAPDAMATGFVVVKRLGKLGVWSGVCEGFIGNRLFTAYRRECEFMLEEGALPETVDAAMEGFGFPMGPFAVGDMAGLQISWARRKRQAATRDPAEPYCAIPDRLCELGRFGQRAGKGWYAYPDGRRTADPDVTALIEAASHEKGIRRRSFESAEIVERVLAALAAEGRAILAEGIALRASDIDLVMINGYGFPAWRGGPMFMAGAT